MADPLSFAVLSASIAGLLMRGAAVAVDPSWSSAASLPNEALNAWRSLRRLQQGRGGQENPLEASIKARLQKQVDDAGERYKRTGVAQSALAGAVTEMEVALTELSGDDDTVVEAARFPDNFETYLRRRTASRRQNVEAAAESFFDDLTRIVAKEFIYRAPGSHAFDIAAFKQLLTGQERLVAGQEQLLEGQAETHGLLGAMATDIKEIHGAIPRGQSASPTRIRFGSRPRVAAGFVKRERQEELFDAILTRAEPRTVLTGMRGCGKTQLAAKVAAKCEEEGWSIVAWINAASRKELVADLYELALHIGIDTPKDIPPENIVRRFLDHLRSADMVDRLFVFDNVENLDDLKDLTPEGDGVRAIITTTRHLDWNSLGWHAFTVGVFKRDQSITLLCGRTGDTHRDAADQIADALGDLPVAITQAAATAKWGEYPLSEYLDRLRNHPLESSISRLEGDDYPDAVGIALFMAYEQALEQLASINDHYARIASSIMGALSLLAASGIPSHWLLYLDKDSDAVRNTLSFLKSNSIIQESSNNKIAAHRLQNQVYRESQRRTYKGVDISIKAAITLINEARNKARDFTSNDFEQQRQEIRNLADQLYATTSQGYSHVLFFDPSHIFILITILEYATPLGMSQIALTLTDTLAYASEFYDPENLFMPGMYYLLANAYQDAGKLDKAIPLFKQTLEDRTRTLGPHHPDTLTARNNLAYAYRDAGRLQDAITLHQQNLEDRTRILGPDHPDTLTTGNNLANTYLKAGRLQDAITLHEQAIEDCTRILGPHHPRTLTTRNNLADTYQEAGKLNEAIALYEQTLEDRTRILGPHHPRTLTTRDNLANTYQEAGKLNEAIALHEQTLEDRTLGSDHPDTLAARNNLANTYRETGRLVELIELHKRTLEDRTRTLGSDHPDTLAARNNLVNAYQDAGKLDEIIELHKQTLKSFEDLLGPNHPRTLTTRDNLAAAYLHAGRLDEAIPLFEQTLKDRTRALGPHHIDTLIAQGNLAAAYWHAGRLDEAIPLFEQTLKDYIRIRGPHHIDTLTIQANLAIAYRTAGRLDEAIPLFEQTLKDYARTLGPSHSLTLASRNNLAITYQEAGILDEAIPLYKQNLEDRTRALGPDHPDTLISRDNLADAYHDAGRPDEAIPLYKQNLEDRTRTLGPDHPDTLTTRHGLAHTYCQAGRPDEAIPLYKQNLDDCTRTLGPHDSRTLITCNNLAVAYQDTGNFDKAIQLHQQNLKNYEDRLGPEHPDTLTSRNNLAKACHKAGKLNEAITLYEQTLDDHTRILGPDHPDTLTTRHNLADAYRAAGRIEDAERLFETPSDSDDDEQGGTEEDLDQETDD